MKIHRCVLFAASALLVTACGETPTEVADDGPETSIEVPVQKSLVLTPGSSLGVLDQFSFELSICYFGSQIPSWGQTFKPTASSLAGVQLAYGNVQAGSSVRVSIRAGSVSGTELGFAVRTLTNTDPGSPASVNGFTFDPAIALTPGATYAIVSTITSGLLLHCYGNGYADGEAWVYNNGAWMPQVSGADLWFATYAPRTNTAPVATDDDYATDEDTPVDIDVLANDTDVDGDVLTAALVTAPSHGSMSLNLDGSFTYTPTLGFYGSDSFTYIANDGLVDSNVATVSITVNRVIPVTIVISSDKKDAPNTINTKGNGLVAVAILGDPDEFALTNIDWSTLAFGPGGATAAHDLSDPATWSGHVMDVNGDGIPDLVTHYSQKATGLVAGDTQACLTGVIDGIDVAACGAVTVR